MRVTPFSRLTREDFSDCEAWHENLFDALNSPFASMSTALAGYLLLTVNMASELVVVDVVHGTAKRVKLNRLRSVPQLVLCGYASGEICTGCTITSYVSTSEVDVTLLFHGSPTTKVSVVLFFLA